MSKVIIALFIVAYIPMLIYHGFIGKLHDIAMLGDVVGDVYGVFNVMGVVAYTYDQYRKSVKINNRRWYGAFVIIFIVILVVFIIECFLGSFLAHEYLILLIILISPLICTYLYIQFHRWKSRNH